MSTTAISSNSSTPTPTATTTAAASTGGYNLKPSDFIKMMVTQLQNQDPTQPVSNSDLLGQMSQIGQLQSSTDLQQSLTSMVLQNQIGSAGNMIGKTVQGLNSSQKSVTGVVTSVRVQGSQAYLKLDSGDEVQLSNVTSISPTAAAAVSTAGTTASKAA